MRLKNAALTLAVPLLACIGCIDRKAANPDARLASEGGRPPDSSTGRDALVQHDTGQPGLGVDFGHQPLVPDAGVPTMADVSPVVPADAAPPADSRAVSTDGGLADRTLTDIRTDPNAADAPPDVSQVLPEAGRPDRPADVAVDAPVAPDLCTTAVCLKICRNREDCDSITSFCDTTASPTVCVQKRSNGEPATDVLQCKSGIVADGVCCDNVCDGCKACTKALNKQTSGSDGMCQAVIAGETAHDACTATDPPCGPDGKCDGLGHCRNGAAGTTCPATCTGSVKTVNACNGNGQCSPVSTTNCPYGCAGTDCKSPTCGDTVVQSPTEQCDDGNTVTEACSYGLKSCTVCDQTCHSVAGAATYCGDGTTQAGHETCDDGNATTEACAYGQTSCTVCDETCHSASGAVSYCGDGIPQSGYEVCDNGSQNSIYGNCSPTCTTCGGVGSSYEPLSLLETGSTGGVYFEATHAAVLHRFKAYHNNSPYQMHLFSLASPDASLLFGATAIWTGGGWRTPSDQIYDTVEVSIPLNPGGYLLLLVGNIMYVNTTDFPTPSPAGIRVTHSFSVGNGLEPTEGTFSTSFWGPFTDLRSCLP